MNKIFALLILLMANFSLSAQSFWTNLSDVPGGDPFYVEEFPNGHLFAQMSYGTLYKSVDDGQTWDLVLEIIENPYGIKRTSMSPSGVLYGMKPLSTNLTPWFDTNYDIYKSTDEGLTWNIVASDVEHHNWVEASTGKLFSINDEHILESNDGGATWTSTMSVNSQGFPGTPTMHQIRIDKNDNLIANIGSAHIAMSIDLGATWKILESHNFNYTTILPSGAYLSSIFIIGQTIVPAIVRGTMSGTVVDTLLVGDPFLLSVQSVPVQLNNGDLVVAFKKNFYRSTDDGFTWQLEPNSCGRRLVQYHATQNDVLFSTEGAEFLRSTDGAATWSLSDGFKEAAVIDLEIEANRDNIWITNSTSVFKSEDGGLTWDRKFTNDCRNLAAIRLLIAPDSTIYVFKDRSLEKSTDGGQTWSFINPPNVTLDSSTWFHLDKTTHTLFLQEHYPYKLWSSTDAGQTWQFSGPLTPAMREVTATPTGRLFARMYDPAIGHSLYFSDDDGVTWVLISDPLLEDVRGVEAGPFGKIYAHTKEQILKSEDDGATWTLVLEEEIGDVKVNGIGHVYTYAGEFPNRFIYRSANAGQTWTEIPSDFYAGFPWVIAGHQKMSFDNEGFLYIGLNYLSPTKTLLRSTYSTYEGAFLEGTASRSIDDDCTTFDPDPFLKDVLIEAKSFENWYSKTDSTGFFDMFLDTGMYHVRPIMPLPFLWDSCALPVNLPTIGTTTAVDLSLPALADCAFVTMDMVAPKLERCFDNPIHFKLCNYGTIATDTAKLYLEIDTFLTLTDTLPWVLFDTTASTNIFVLDVGFMDVSDCQEIIASVYVDCDTAIMGDMHCLQAWSTPDSFCIEPPMWSGANISADAVCNGTTVTLSLTNIGDAPSAYLDFIVIEDDVVLMHGNDALNIDETKSYEYPADGSYLRIEAEQEPGHPFSQQVTAWNFGCNGSGATSSNFVFQYFNDNGSKTEDIECRRNTSSYDPNDKRGFPLGYGSDNIIPKNTQIEYMVRFQNTGTAPARKVVIADTLSAHLDRSTLQIEAASHDFTWDFIGLNVIEFTFDNIFLPDSNANEAASHGWVSYKIKPLSGLALETQVETQAGIYFDFNPAVLTNVTHHQLGENFVPVSAKDIIGSEAAQLSIYPNPSDDIAYVLPSGNAEQIQSIEVYNLLGINILQRKIQNSSTPMALDTKQWAEGTYFVKATLGSGRQEVVKLVVTH